MVSLVAWSFVALAAIAALAVAIQAARRPILFRMAARNAARRPRQTATVIAGLMIGTAIISAALIAGGSAGQAIRGAVYDALGDVDETVRLDTFNFYDEAVLDAYRVEPAVADWMDGLAANIIWDVAVTNERTDLFEPRVAAVGYEPEADAAFRPFELTDGTRIDGRDIAPGQAIITADLAEAIEARIGDSIEMRYTPPVDPLIPEIFPFDGTLAASVAGPLVPPLPAPLVPLPAPLPAAQQASHTFNVDKGATDLSVVVGWAPLPAPLPLPVPLLGDLHIRVTDPAGNTWESAALGADAAPPVFVNVSAEDGFLADGTWTVTLSSTFTAGTSYAGAAVVLYPIYDAAELQRRIQELREQSSDFDFEDILRPFGAPETRRLEIVAITDGGRGDQFDFGDAVFMHFEEAQDAFDRQDQINVIKFSNPGGIESGGDRTDEAVARLNATLQDIKAAHPDDGAIQNLQVRPVKQDFIQLADDAGQLMTSLLLFAGSLTVITGLLLIVNIFTMLAEERRSELGMARAVGLSRRGLVRLFMFEGSLYAVAAAAIGAVLGLGLAAAIVAILNAILAQLDGGFPAIDLIINPSSLLIAFSAGTLLTFLTILVSSRRIARLNIVRAIRGIEEPDKVAKRMTVIVGFSLAVVGLFVAVAGWIAQGYEYKFSLQIFGALALAIGVAVGLRRWVRRNRLYPAVAAALFAYYVVTYFITTKYDNVSEVNIVGPIRGVILTLCVVVMVAYFDAGTRAFGRLLARFKRMRPIAIPAVSYPQHKRFRTGMTLAMFSIVLLSIGFFSIFGGLFDRPAEIQTGGFEIEATTTLEVDDLAAFDRGLIPAGTIEGVVRLEDFFTPDVGLVTVSGERTGQFQGQPGHHIYGVQQDFLDAHEFRLLWRLDEYATDSAAYDAILARDDVVIVAYPYSTNELGQDLEHEVGETLQLRLSPTDTREFTIIGIQEQFHFPGIFLDQQLVATMFPTTTDALYLYNLAPGTDAGEVAKLLEQNYRDAGMNAEASVEKVQEEQEAFRQILAAMKMFLGLGLIIGTLSLGIVTARSVIERRQEIGVMRALGYTPNMIRRIFFIEVTVTVALGALIGIVCSIIVTLGLWVAIIRELNYPYVIPWGELALLIGISYVVALLATLAPIRRAAKVAPAEALRYIE